MTSLFDLFQLVAGNVWLYGGAFVLVLSLLVFVHEWGHYIVARRCGVRVESFSIGFGPEIFGRTDKHGTRWKFSIFPLGGYVKMFGDVDPASAHHDGNVKDSKTQELRTLTDAERAQAFYAQPVGKRAAIVFAGPAINFLFAIAVMAGLFIFYGQPVTPPLAAAIIKGSSAEVAGFIPHDEVLSIDGEKVRRFEDIKRIVMVGLDSNMTFTIRRGGAVMYIQATPHKVSEDDHFGFRQSRGLLGLISPGNAIDIAHIASIDGKALKGADEIRKALVARMGSTFLIELGQKKETDRLIINPLASMNSALTDPKSPDYNHLVVANTRDQTYVKHGLQSGIVEAINATWQTSSSTLYALWQMVTGTRSATELGGIIRIGAITSDMARSGIVALISFTALLSINLGLINLFPIPMLDGGHLLFYIVESLKGSPISEQIQEYAFRLGLAILVGIMLFANLNDIVQLVL